MDACDQTWPTGKGHEDQISGRDLPFLSSNQGITLKNMENLLLSQRITYIVAGMGTG